MSNICPKCHHCTTCEPHHGLCPCTLVIQPLKPLNFLGDATGSGVAIRNKVNEIIAYINQMAKTEKSDK